jgi:hypothetical protein
LHHEVQHLLEASAVVLAQHRHAADRDRLGQRDAAGPQRAVAVRHQPGELRHQQHADHQRTQPERQMEARGQVFQAERHAGVSGNAGT